MKVVCRANGIASRTRISESVNSLPRVTQAQAKEQGLQAVGQYFDKYSMISSDTTRARGLISIGSTRTNVEESPCQCSELSPLVRPSGQVTSGVI